MAASINFHKFTIRGVPGVSPPLPHYIVLEARTEKELCVKLKKYKEDLKKEQKENGKNT